MKKLLAMVLALVMTLSLAVSANAFKDDTKISDDYAEAVAVLNGMGVFKGYEDGEFKPANNITRAEVSAIVYRVYTQDVKDSKASLYATYNKFSDMTGAGWAAGYIGYCANAELVKGYPDGTFKPSGNVTGYEVLAMILRAVGYDKNGEFSGADWALHVAQTAQQAGVLKNVKGVDLNAPATRELVAELLFRAIAEASTVTYTPAFGYVTDKVIGTTATTLGSKNFELKDADDADDWGRPATKWTYNVGDKETVVVDKPVVSYTKAVAECDVAHDAGLKKDTAYTLIVNGQDIGKYTVNLTDTTTKMGAQGRLFEVYDDTIVMIDTFLAKVTYVADIAYDAQGHVKGDGATITLKIYDSKTENQETTTLTLTDKDANYGYAKDEYVLVNAVTVKENSTAVASGKVDTTTANKYAEIVGKATSVDGAQSVIYWNAAQHNVEGTVYDDAVKFYLDEAKQSDAKYTWFFDQYGNLIGDVAVAATNSYGVINSIWWAGNATDGSGVAKANVTYMDGTTAQVDISEMIYDGATEQANSYDAKYGTVTHSTNYTTAATLMQAVSDTTAKTDFFYVDSYATENARATVDSNKIVAGHLFQFTTKSNGTVKAMEVSGTGAAIEVEDSANKVVASVDAKMFYSVNVAVNKNTQIYTDAQGAKMVVNDNTMFLIRSGDGTSASPFTYSSVKGFTNVGSYTAENEVDYVDLNKDGVADYVYVTSPSATSKVTSLFFFDGQQGAYTLADGTWVVKGYVDGEPGEVKFDIYDLNNVLTASKTSSEKVSLTKNTLYAVALEDGVVKQGYVVATGSTVEEISGYELSSAYETGKTYKVDKVVGAVADSFNNSLYTDAETTPAYYSVITDVTKVVGTMGNPADQDYYFVYIANDNGAENRLCTQAYAYDKDSTSSSDVKADAAVTKVELTNEKKAVITLNDNNNSKQDDVYTVTLEQLRDNGYVTVGTFTGTVASDGATSVEVDLTGVISTGNTYKVSIGAYSAVKAF